MIDVRNVGFTQTASKVISVKENTSLLVLLPSFLRCNDSYIVARKVQKKSVVLQICCQPMASEAAPQTNEA
uniref:Uncharacterized protein n=1 Tax=Candidatus Kentrum sp. FM TaxID=2126340 RepID=A0A450T719_9GAMM|nr:MAG: hypothetical protein BECKFM1743A_GA0114220_102312 [Candidatus Kentron sp. FM]VFJ62456.1 MAG: hypothetical protein BECKFM1743C_GA0114222_103173 [Candidatus Kentron sp. FM]